MNTKQAIAYVESIGSVGIVPGLDSIRRLCAKLGDPQNHLQFIHIAGTNGKGSALAFISTILQCSGYRVGRYISPVLFDYRDRIQVNQRPITGKALGEGMELVKNACDSIVAQGFLQPSPFEVETALALWYFEQKKCDIVVLETGMGGRLDATNLIQNTLVAVLASVGMDHMQFLGGTLAEIAAQKAGIIKPGSLVVSMRQKPEAMQVIRSECENLGVSLVTADAGEARNVRYGLEKQRFDYGGFRKLEIGLAGKFQIDNAILALEAVKSLEAASPETFSVPESAIRKGLATARWPGRFQVLGKRPLFILDGAHNEDAAQKLANSIEFYFTNRRIIYIMGMLRDKECDRVAELTARYADHIITVTPPENPRALSALELAEVVSGFHNRVTVADSLEEALELSLLLAGQEDVVLCFGSLSFLGRMTKLYEKNQVLSNRKPQGGRSRIQK